MIAKNKLKFTVNSEGNRVKWSAEKLPLNNQDHADFWRLHMDDGYRREMTVKSSDQVGTVKETKQGHEICYNSITSVEGTKFDVKLTIHIVNNGGDSLEFWADVENHDTARVNEIQLPFIDLTTICDNNRANDKLYRSKGLGECIENPWKALDSAHTEYMAADYNEIWSPMLYPKPCSMSWFGIESAGNFLYVGRHDNDFRICNLVSGISPRGTDPRLITAVSHYPFAEKGELISCGHSIVTLMQGNWTIGSDIYSNWARENWYKVPNKPEWVHKMTGWQRIILKHQYGEVFFKYADLPRVYKEGLKSGLDTLMVFGWWKGRFDNGYPIYEVDPELGGEEGLKAAIAEIQALGGRVILYTNGVLIDKVTDYYKEEGHKISRKDIDGNEFMDHYQFANNGTVLRTFGYKSFVAACNSEESWKNKLLENGKYKLSFNPDSIFFDQIGGHKCWLCFDKSHKHGNRTDMDAKYRAENLKAMRELCTGDRALGSENTVDIFAPHLDYNHGCDLGNWYADNSFPQMYRRTFPETIMTNRFIHDCRDDYKSQLNFAFIQGHRFDVSIYRGRVCGIAGEPEYTNYIKKLIDLKEIYKRFFYEGKYVVDTQLSLPKGVHMCEYVHGNERLFAFWNMNEAPCSVSVSGNDVLLNADDVACYVLAD